MKNTLDHSVPFEKFFEEISRIPRGSGNEAGIAEYMMRFAAERGLEAEKDEWNNVLVRKPGSAGSEGAAPVILQAHSDMVCVKEAWSGHDFLADPIELIREGDALRANGTTLGADDGAGVATILALLDDPSFPHPPLEAFFTSSEETGMYGAKGFDYSKLRGRRMISMDSGGENISSVNAAACETMEIKLPLKTEKGFGSVMKLRISGLRGGHSGSCIDMERANAIKLAALFLRTYLNEKVEIFISRFEAGTVTNAIPSSCEVIFGCDNAERVEKITSEFSGKLLKELGENEPEAKIVLEGTANSISAASKEDSRRLVELLLLLPSLRRHKSLSIEGFVTASSNLATVHMEEDEAAIGFSMRADTDFKLDVMEGEASLIARLMGAECSVFERTPCWEYKKDSAMRQLAAELMPGTLGKPLVEEFEHGGLECGHFAKNLPGLDIFVIGPAGREVHSTAEWLDLASAKRVYAFMKAYLGRLIKQ